VRTRPPCHAALLRTQPTMHAAHRLHARAGFVRAPERDMREHSRIFPVYKMPLQATFRSKEEPR
jgi:hypothetical protein